MCRRLTPRLKCMARKGGKREFACSIHKQITPAPISALVCAHDGLRMGPFAGSRQDVFGDQAITTGNGSP